MVWLRTILVRYLFPPLHCRAVDPFGLPLVYHLLFRPLIRKLLPVVFLSVVHVFGTICLLTSALPSLTRRLLEKPLKNICLTLSLLSAHLMLANLRIINALIIIIIIICIHK